MVKILKNIASNENGQANTNLSDRGPLSGKKANNSSLTAKIFNFRSKMEKREAENKRQERKVYEDIH